MKWFIRKWFWNFISWVKFSLNKPVKTPLPPKLITEIKPVEMREAIKELPIEKIKVCGPDDIPADERTLAKTLVYKLQVWLYSAFPPMQAGLPSIDADPQKALRQAFTRLHRTRFAPPELPAEFLGSPDLGSLAVRGPYAGYLEKVDEGTFAWNLSQLDRYDHHPGLRRLGVKVLFRVDPLQRSLRAFQIETAMGTVKPDDAYWELSKQIALCAVSTHTSLIRHFNWIHLACGGAMGIATRNALPGEHALCRLLWPHVYATEQNSDMVTRGQMLPGGDFETSFSFTFGGMCQLFEDSFNDFRITTSDPARDAEIRQIVGQGFDTPTQDNMEALFDVIHAYVREYLSVYFPGKDAANVDEAVADDKRVRDWLDQLNKLIPNAFEITSSDVTFDGLARLVARFIFMSTAQHELLGGFLWNYQLWPHRQPSQIRLDGKREPLDVYQRLVNANYNLNVHRVELMHDFSYLAPDDAGKKVMASFNTRLDALQKSMEQEPWAVWKLYPKALKASINA